MFEITKVYKSGKKVRYRLEDIIDVIRAFGDENIEKVEIRKVANVS